MKWGLLERAPVKRELLRLWRNVVEPIPIPLLGDPLASDSATLSVREGASPQSSDLASNKSDETKTAVGEVRETFFPSSACVCCWILTHYPKRRRPRSG